MRFTDLFIRRPVLALVVSLLILLIGARAMYGLQIRQYPKLSNTTITVTTVYPGASPDLIEGCSLRTCWDRAPRSRRRE